MHCRRPICASPPEVTPQRKKEKTFEALLRQVEGLSRQQPVLVLFDDLHWIDRARVSCWTWTIERLANWPVLLLTMFRPEFQPPWTGQPHVTLMALSRLDRRDAAAMVATIAGDTTLPAQTMKEIAEPTDGVPLFVEELTKSVLESGCLYAFAGNCPRRQERGPGRCRGNLTRLTDGAAGSAGIGCKGGGTNRRSNRPRV